jgi:plastocyanin
VVEGWRAFSCGLKRRLHRSALFWTIAAVRKFALATAFALVLASCARGAGGAQTRTVLVDFSHDEFASFFLEYFPRQITVRPGDTVDFKQTWTGEPHSVTMGTLVDEALNTLKPAIQRFREGASEGQVSEEFPELEARFEELFAPLPWMAKEGEGFEAAQNGAQPCYLNEGTAPTDPDTPCTEEQQKQPAFNGRQSYYNSGYIHYAGPRGNTFTVELAEDIAPGTYNYYCNLHGPLQSGEIVVKAAGSEIPSQAEVNRQARDEIEKMVAPLRTEFQKAQQGKVEVPEEARPAIAELGALKDGQFFSGNLGGLSVEEQEGVFVHGGINEFIPGTIRAKVGEKVSWVILGPHTVSFNVPRFFPIVDVKSDGTVETNPRINEPAGGSPPPPRQQEQGEGPPEPLVVDGGSWGGSGFFSSGFMQGFPFAVYRLTFTRAGSYKYACLIHPKMVGTVEVT